MKLPAADAERLLLALAGPGNIAVGRDRHRKVRSAHRASVGAGDSVGYIKEDCGGLRNSPVLGLLSGSRDPQRWMNSEKPLCSCFEVGAVRAAAYSEGEFTGLEMLVEFPPFAFCG